MCKHILINDFSISDLATLKEFTSRTNEDDGYGAIIRTKSNKIEVLKAIDLASFYMDLTSRVTLGDVKTLVVHHRTSTNGNGIEYAHPFEYKGVYMTHNGVVSVPDKHKTLTTNDSEQLLHHLIKSDFNTKSISGYYSCFLLTELDTAVLVDDTAPMYSDGRIYCSHNLSDAFVKVDVCLLTLDTDSGAMLTHEKIIVTKSSYGREFMGKSLGGVSYTNDYESKWSTHWNDLSSLDDTPPVTEGQAALDFMDLITDEEKTAYYDLNYRDSMDYILDLSVSMGLDMTREDAETIIMLLEKDVTEYIA